MSGETIERGCFRVTCRGTPLVEHLQAHAASRSLRRFVATRIVRTLPCVLTQRVATMCGAPGCQGQTCIRALSTKGYSTSLPPPRRTLHHRRRFSSWCRIRHAGLVCHSVEYRDSKVATLGRRSTPPCRVYHGKLARMSISSLTVRRIWWRTTDFSLRQFPFSSQWNTRCLYESLPQHCYDHFEVVLSS
jgi:hypothetical protein